MKKILTILMCSILLFSFYTNAQAYTAPEVDVSINGVLIDFTDETFLKNSLTYVPLRDFCEQAGLFVDWDNSQRRASVSYEQNLFERLENKYGDLLERIENGFWEDSDIETLKKALQEMQR